MTSNLTRIHSGKRMVIIGFIIAIIGVVFYCMASFSAGLAQNEPPFVKESLMIIGVGVLVWLIGAVRYLNAVMDSDSSDEHLF